MRNMARRAGRPSDGSSAVLRSVAYVSRSGGMSNELNNIISRWTNGVYEGVAIGGDRYPGTTFMDHIMRYQRDPSVSFRRRQLRCPDFATPRRWDLSLVRAALLGMTRFYSH